MGLAEFFGFITSDAPSGEIPDIFPLSISSDNFIKTDIVAIYTKILTDVLERTHGLSDDQIVLMWDNCVKSNSSDGVITLLSKAMADRKDLFLVFEDGVDVIREATAPEQDIIRKDYEAKAESDVGVFISFKNFTRSDMLKFYIALEYCTVGSLNKSMNLSRAIQLKMKDLRASVAVADSSSAKSRATEIAQGLGLGKDVLLDAEDEIVTNVPDLTSVKASIDFLIQKKSFYLGLPDSYLIGEQTSGMGTSGENDMRAVERGLKAYFFSIMKPVLESLFEVPVTYKSQDFRHIAGALDVLKIFSITDDTLVSQENKRRILNGLLDLPEDAVGDPPKKVVVAQPVVPGNAPQPAQANA